jgi:hypothetical protein
MRVQGALEDRPVHLHDRDQHVDRGDPGGASLQRDTFGALADERDDVAVLGVGRLGEAFAVNRLVSGAQSVLADAQRLQCRSDLAVQAQDAQPALGLVLGRSRERDRRGGYAEHDRCVGRQRRHAAHGAT